MVELAAKLKGTDNPELADAFLAFIMTDTFQNLIAEGNGRCGCLEVLNGLRPFRPAIARKVFYSEEEAATLRGVAIENAPRAFQITAGASVAAFVLFPLWAVWRHSDALTSLGEAEWAALWFTLKQAPFCLSVCLFCFLCTYWHGRFWGRQFVIVVLGAPFVLLVIVAILG